MRSTPRRKFALRGPKKAATYIGATAALIGAGSAGAIAFSTAAHGSAHPASHVAAARVDSATRKVVTDGLAKHNAAPAASVKHAGSASTVASVKVAQHGQAAPAKTAASHKPAAQPAASQPPSWSQVQQTVAKQTSPSEPAAANQLQPVPTAGPQSYMQLSSAQVGNATTIVQQSLQKGMGMRSAVIAVATSMQESQLQNINYGDQDSLGLFQQRPSMGWGTAQQILTPSYAADAFLKVLAQQQATDPSWANQPLWATAQAVQKSGFPMAYAKWESQAVQLVKNIVTQVK
jgi:hypothetical protein